VIYLTGEENHIQGRVIALSDTNSPGDIDGGGTINNNTNGQITNLSTQPRQYL